MEIVNEKPDNKSGAGCGLTALFVFIVFWIGFITVVGGVVQFSFEQTVFEGSLGIPDIRWLVPLVSCGLYMLALLPVSIFVKHPAYRRLYQIWLLVSLFVLLTVPARIPAMTNYLAVIGLQILALLVAGAGVVFWSRRSGKHEPSQGLFNRNALLVAVICGLILLFPWVLWGSLGGPADVIGGGVLTVLFSIVISMIIRMGVFSGLWNSPSEGGRAGFLWEGFLVGITLSIALAGISQNGNNWLIGGTFLGLGWVIAGVYRMSRTNTGWGAAALILALALCGPILGFDPDELMAVTGMENGEVMQWAGMATLLSMGLCLIMGIVLLIFNDAIKYREIVTLPLAAGSGLILVGLLALYFTSGRSGFHGEQLFVVMHDQADVSAAKDIVDYNQRRGWVYHTLVDHANETQANLRAELKKYHIDYQPFYLVNGVKVNGGPLVRWWLSQMPGVERVIDVMLLRPLPGTISAAVGTDPAPRVIPWNLTLIGAKDVWKMGITGKGIVVGNSDTGAQKDHPEIAGNYRGLTEGDDYNWYDPWTHLPSPVDFVGHGTHTMGSILGKQVGVAPGATWMACMNMRRNLGNVGYYLDCWQFMLAPFPLDGDPFVDGDPTRGAHVLNNSWGCPEVEGCDSQSFLPAVEALRSAGVFVVVSAGNSGMAGCSSIKDPPSFYDQVFSVGAVNQAEQLSIFSSMGPVTVDESGRVKPDVVAPGEEILSAYPGSTYSIASGTSMAGPHVVGLVALLWSANPKLIGDIERTEQIIIQTAKPISTNANVCSDGTISPNNGSGYGLIDAFAAVKLALEDK